MSRWFRKKRQVIASASDGDSMETFQLIEGHFSPAQAADILLSLLNDKIKFHTVRLLNLNQMDSMDSLHSENRIQELKEAKNKITETILKAQSEGKQLKIHSAIEVSIKD